MIGIGSYGSAGSAPAFYGSSLGSNPDIHKITHGYLRKERPINYSIDIKKIYRKSEEKPALHVYLYVTIRRLLGWCCWK